MKGVILAIMSLEGIHVGKWSICGFYLPFAVTVNFIVYLLLFFFISVQRSTF